MLLAAAILRTDRRIVKQLRSADALSPERAMELSVPPAIGPWRLRRLVQVAAIGKAESSRYFLQSEGYERYQQQRRRRGLIVMGVLLLLLAAIWLLQNFQKFP